MEMVYHNCFGSSRLHIIPGYSEHQIGLAVDINGATYDFYF